MLEKEIFSRSLGSKAAFLSTQEIVWRFTGCKPELDNFPALGNCSSLYGSDGKEPACRRLGFNPCPGKRNGYSFQYSYLENSMDRGAWLATVHGVTKSWTRLSDSHTQVMVLHSTSHFVELL